MGRLMNEGDVIRRQAAIDVIKDADVCVCYSENESVEIEDVIDLAIRATKRSVIASIEQMPSAQPGWIPCSERLPEDVGIGEEYPTVIFCTKDAVYAGFYAYDCDGGGHWWVCDESEYLGRDVIAWMELPKPWEGDTDGKDD